MKLTVDNTEFNVYLTDDGTLDTVIEVDGIEHRFDGEYASYWRDDNGAMTEEGLETLAKECINDCEEHW